MKRYFALFTMVCLSALTLFTACNEKYPGYKKASDGLYYKFYKHDVSAAKPKPTDFLKVGMSCYLNDSLYFDWQELNSGVYSQLSSPRFAGDLQSAYAMMHLGDSASFYIKADSVALLYYDQDPQAVGLKPEDYFRYEIKLLEIKTQEEFQANVEELKNKMMKASINAFDTYIKENNINVSPLDSRVYVVPLEKGKGRCPVKGERVEIDFSASLLNGQPIGTTFGREEKFSFVLGEGFVIPGWEVIVPTMRVGDRVRAFIPFEMAYGEHSVADIPPYANLVYEIKLLGITPVDVENQ